MTQFTFEIEKLAPLGLRDLWIAKMAVTQHVEIDQVPVQNIIQMTVSFQYAASGSADGLLNAAYDAAQASLQHTSGFVDSNQLSALRDQTAAALESEYFGFTI